MATIKAYTDIDQSRKLAEILPLESADMYYRDWKRDTKDIRIANVGSAGKEDLPCWSLAALLHVLPKIGAEEPMIIKMYYASEPKERYVCEYGLTDITSEYDNPVDACYEMILKLNELKIL